MEKSNIVLECLDWVKCTPEDAEQINRILRWQEGKVARKIGDDNGEDN